MEKINKVVVIENIKISSAVILAFLHQFRSQTKPLCLIEFPFTAEPRIQEDLQLIKSSGMVHGSHRGAFQMRGGAARKWYKCGFQASRTPSNAYAVLGIKGT